MTQPNQHLPGQFVMTTRRTMNQHFWLAPWGGTGQLFLYSCGLHAKRHGQAISGAVLEDTHAHVTQLDMTGERAAYHRDQRGIFARARNKRLGREGKFWDEQRPSDVVLLDEDSAIEKLLYLLLNPVRDGFVERVHHYPGALILPRHWKKELIIPKPRYFFSRHQPDHVIVPTCVPPGFEDYDIDDVIHWFEGEIRDREEHYSQKRVDEARLGIGSGRVRGRRWCLNVDPHARVENPKPKRPIGERVNPRWASRSHERLTAAETNRKQWIRLHLVARRKFKNGKRGVLFPPGTVQMRTLAGARVRDPDTLTLWAAGGWRDPNWTPPNFPRPPT